jgi:glycosyltransferase involved in cell wall biosynthesis
MYRFLGKEEITPLDRAAAQHRVDIMWFPTPLFESINLPYIYTIWDLQHRLQPFFPEVGTRGLWEGTEKMFCSAIRRAAYVVTGTEQGRHEIVQCYQVKEERIEVIPFPTPDIDTRNEETVPESTLSNIQKPYLFYPAQFWPHKNHTTLIEALECLSSKHGLDFDLVLTGSDKGNLDHVKKTVKKLDLDKRVHFLGFVSRNTLLFLYENAFALIFPSLFGPDNLPPLEAFALGCPVVAGSILGAEEQLGDAAILVDPLDGNAIAEAVKRLSIDPDIRRNLIERGRIRAGKWTARDYVESVLALIDRFQPYRRCWSTDERYVPKG